jgi:excinuclease ABC subunit B
MPKPPRKASRPKAGKPELKPLGEHLASLLNPALVSGPPIGFAEPPAAYQNDLKISGVEATAASLKDLL